MHKIGYILLQDNFARQFSYVRLSLTERCNFKCQYCLPNGYQECSPEPALNLHEISNLVAGLVELGIWKIRLTGGEPTLRRDLLEIMQLIRSFPQIKTLAITTNAYKLGAHLDEYIAAGLTNLNISMDSLNRERFHQITQVDKLDAIQQTIQQALASNLQQVKINAVLIKHSLDELADFLAYIQDKALSLRFIELMQTSDNQAYFQENYVSAEVLRAKLQALGWIEQPRQYGAGPAIEFRQPNSIGSVGIIAPYSKNFCSSCNRLRFTQDGALRLCLFGDENYSLRHLLQNSNQREELKASIIKCMGNKSIGHQLAQAKTGNIMNLSNVGG